MANIQKVAEEIGFTAQTLTNGMALQVLNKSKASGLRDKDLTALFSIISGLPESEISHGALVSKLHRALRTAKTKKVYT